MGFSMLPNAELTVVWRFSNGHTWSKDFPCKDDADHFVRCCDLVGHPSVSLVGMIQHSPSGTRMHYLKGKDKEEALL
jgi:hypothetical protein